MSERRSLPRGPCPRTSMVGLGLVLSGAACGGGAREEAPAPWFREEAGARGLVFEHRSGTAGEYLFPELMGGGAALFDMDGDGDLDAFLVQSGNLAEPSAPVDHGLFENRGDGTFEDVRERAGVAAPGYGMGVAVGDYDGDGDDDLYVTNLGPNVLLANDGQGNFEDVTARAGVGDAGWGSSACFFDMDRDGDLDLFVANYVAWSRAIERDCFDPSGRRDYCGPAPYDAPSPDTLFRNEGDGTFTDVSEAAGLRAAYGNGLGVVPGDFDGDGWLDLFVANDLTPDQLWHNQGDGTFEDRAPLAGVALDDYGRARAGMGVDAADPDDDDDLDLVVVHMARETTGFFRNEGAWFSEDTARAGIGTIDRQRTRFGVGFQDFDLDGWLDIFITNGRVNQQMEPLDPDDPYAEPNVLMRGSPSGRWEEVLPPGGTAEPLLATSRGAAFGDVDGDGAVDVLVANRDGRAHLLRNVAPRRGSFLIARLVDERGHDALGASALFSIGERRVRRDVKSAYSYCAASDPRLHVGLGEHARVDEILVRWLDGKEERFGPFDGGQAIELRHGGGR